VVGAFGVGKRLFNLAYLPAIGFNNAAMVMIGQCHAAGLPRRARQTSIDTTWITVSITAGIAGLLALFPEFWMELFSESADVVAAGRPLVLFTASALPFVALVLLTNGYFNAMNQGFYAMLPTVAHRLALEPVAIWLGVSVAGVTGAWFGLAVGGWIAGLGALLILFSRWRALRREARELEAGDGVVELA
jgi:Na+-driven multidrug efflux pump